MAVPIERADVTAMLTEAVSPDIVAAVTAASAALGTFPVVPMGNKTMRIPVQNALATAGFVAEGAVKPQTEVTWSSETITAEEIAAIAVVHENVIADAGSDGFDLWALIRPQIVAGFAKVLDGAVFFGTNKPASWPVGIVPAAVAAGNVVEMATAGLDVDLSATLAKVEDSGFDANRWYVGRGLRGKMRALRTQDGAPLYISSIQAGTGEGEIYGLPATTVRNGAWPADTVAMALVGDSTKAVLGLRSDVTFRIFDTGSVGGVSLLETDQVALRATMRVGFAVAKPVVADASGGYPFAVLRNAAAAVAASAPAPARTKA